ncbi:MAG: M12 family metallopeptidase [Bacteroidota bacterium]
MSNSQICFDRILPKDLFKPKDLIILNFAGSTVARAAFEKRKLWINGSTLRVKFMEGNTSQHNQVKKFANEWSNFGNIKFLFNDANDAEIRITFDPNKGSWSYIGTDCRNIPLNEATMNFGWLDKAVVLHEFGHALGMIHEHQNPQGGIKWNKPKVYEDLGGSPNFWSPSTVDRNMFKTYGVDQINGTEVDKKSIMLYQVPQEWTLDDFSSVKNTELSEIDKSFIGSDKIYPKGNVLKPAVELPLSSTNVTTGNIGQPGEEDLFTFTVTKDGRYRIQTKGFLDVTMKVFGPDSQTNLIAEDDNSGPFMNSKLVLSLIPGKYYIQIRHSDNQATGTYKIFVSKKRI